MNTDRIFDAIRELSCALSVILISRCAEELPLFSKTSKGQNVSASETHFQMFQQNKNACTHTYPYKQSKILPKGCQTVENAVGNIALLLSTSWVFEMIPTKSGEAVPS